MTIPKVSIILPTYNRSYILWKAIQSVQAQTFTNWELLIIDDHSDDNTEKLIREFRHDHRIKYSKSNYIHKASGARKTGCDLALGEYIAYLDSDNTAFPHWLALAINKIEQSPNKIALFTGLNSQVGKLEYNNNIEIYKQSSGYDFNINEETIISHQFEGDPNGMVHRASLLKQIDGWDPNLENYDDYDFLLQIITLYPDGVEYLPSVCIDYTRLYGVDGVCNSMTYKKIVSIMKYIYKKHKNNQKWCEKSGFIKKIKEYEK